MTRLFLALIGLNLLWAPVNLWVSLATHHGMSPVAIALTRWVSMGLLLAALLRIPKFREITRAKPIPRADAVRTILIGAALFAPAHLLYYSALQSSSTSVGTVLNTTAPVWVAIFSIFILHERMTPRRLAATVVGLVGAYVVSIGIRLPDVSQGDVAQNLRYLLGTVVECLAGVLATRILRRTSGITVFAYQIWGGVITFAIAPLLFGGSLGLQFPERFDFVPVASILYLILIAGLLCWGSWYVVVERTPLNLMILSTLVQPILGVVIGHYVNDEAIGKRLILGSALVVSALLIAARETASAHGVEVRSDQQDGHED